MNEKAQVLVVVDSPAQEEELKTLLIQDRYSVAVVRYDNDVRLCLQRHQPLVIIIVDLDRPVAPVNDLAPWFDSSGLLNDIPRLFLTSIAGHEYIARQLKVESASYFLKPFHPKPFLSRVRELIAECTDCRRYHPGPVAEFFIRSDAHRLPGDRNAEKDVPAGINRALPFVRPSQSGGSSNGSCLGNKKSGQDNCDFNEGQRPAFDILEESLNNLEQSIKVIVQILAVAVEEMADYSPGHQHRVAELARAIAMEMGFSSDAVEDISTAALIHDVGMIYVPAEVLGKPTGLNAGERKMVQLHPAVGSMILQEIQFSSSVASIVHHHHECLDGSGYPRD